MKPLFETSRRLRKKIYRDDPISVRLFEEWEVAPWDSTEYLINKLAKILQINFFNFDLIYRIHIVYVLTVQNVQVVISILTPLINISFSPTWINLCETGLFEL